MKLLTYGNNIVVRAALDAGASFFAGYPITPASTIMENWALEAAKNKELIFLQSEDEIAALHAVIGASLGGCKAFTATSGPGFSLMQEGLGLAFSASIPVVVVNVMRQGPSTGMPTKTAQGDILQTQFGTHGEYKAIVLYPGNLSEIYKCTIEAFNAAERSLSPVILLLDATLGHLYETLEVQKLEKKDIVEHRINFGTSSRHFSGLSQDGDGNIKTSNSNIFEQEINIKLNRVDMAAKYCDMYEYKHVKNADTLVIAFGVVSRLIEKNGKFSLFRPLRLFPIIEELKKISKKYKKIIVAEMNSGQYSFALQGFLQRKMETVKILGGRQDPQIILKEIYDKI